MPSGWTSISLRYDLYKSCLDFIEAYNKKIGFKRFRSVSHLIEEAVADFVDFRVLELKEDLPVDQR